MSEVNATPIDPLDALAQRLQQLEEKVSAQVQRAERAEKSLLQMTEILRKSESAFQIRVTKALANVFGSMAHSLEHAVQQHTLPKREMNILVISEEEAKANPYAIYVKRVGDQLDFSLASNPEHIQNEGTEPIAAKMKELGLLETDGWMYIRVEVETTEPGEEHVEQQGQPAN